MGSVCFPTVLASRAAQFNHSKTSFHGAPWQVTAMTHQVPQTCLALHRNYLHPQPQSCGSALIAFYRKEDKGSGKSNDLPKASSSQIPIRVPRKFISLPYHPASLVTNKNMPLSFPPCPVIVIKSINSETTAQSAFQGCGCKDQKLPEARIKNAVAEPSLPESLTSRFIAGLIHSHVHECFVRLQYRWSESHTWRLTGLVSAYTPLDHTWTGLTLKCLSFFH